MRSAQIFSSAEAFPDFTFPLFLPSKSHSTSSAISYDSTLLCIYCYLIGMI